MKIAFVYADRPHEWNTSNWRCVIPARAINKTGRHQAELINILDFERNTPESQAICAQSDIIVVERNFRGDVLPAILQWKSKNKVMIANFDDAYQLMPKSNISYPYWFEGQTITRLPDGREVFGKMSPTPMVQFGWGLRTMHAGIVPSKILAQDWKDYTKMHLVPNYIDLTNYKSVSDSTRKTIIIGWGGSLSHYQSFINSGVMSALKQVCKMRSHVRILICGDERIFKEIDVPEKQKVFKGFVSYSEWPGLIANFDIGLAPLHGAYDNRRSWIKPLEYMVLKIPWAASDNPAYEEIGEYGKLVKNSASSWEDALLDMVDNIDRYREKANDLSYQFGISQSIDKNIEKVLVVFSEIAKTAGVSLQI